MAVLIVLMNVAQPNLMYSWAHLDPVEKHADVVPGKLPSLDWLLTDVSSVSSSHEKTERVQQGATFFSLSLSFNAL